MSLTIQPTSAPLVVDAEGVVRVGGSRVTLDTVAGAFKNGATPEEIVQQYPTLALVDVYAVIAYYLQYRREVEGYLKERRQQARRVRVQNEGRYDRQAIRRRLLARRTAVAEPQPDPYTP